MAAVYLDTGPLSLITHPRNERREEARRRLLTLLDGGSLAVLPEIADYEHRRKLLHLESRGSLRRVVRLLRRHLVTKLEGIPEPLFVLIESR